jgi:hypothetical protein
MKSYRIAIISLSIILLTAGCKKNNVISDKQHVLFQYDYVNFAWGYVHEGFYIDDDGNVLTYENPDNWNYNSKDYNLTEGQLAENLSRCRKSGIQISKDELAKYSAHIKNIASSKVTALKSVGADAGTSVFICYEFSEESGIYKGFLIKMEGDNTCENLNFYSKKVSLWLKDVNKTITKGK